MTIFKNKILLFLHIFILIFLVGCQKPKVDPITGKVKRFEPNAKERALNSDSGLLGLGSKKSGNSNYEFSTSNVLWRASLNTLEFMPLSNLSYSGGVIVTDWYSAKNSREQIKINLRFLSNELSASSIKVSSFKKICENDNEKNCQIVKLKDDFNNKIKLQILEEARSLKVKDEMKK